MFRKGAMDNSDWVLIIIMSHPAADDETFISRSRLILRSGRTSSSATSSTSSTTSSAPAQTRMGSIWERRASRTWCSISSGGCGALFSIVSRDLWPDRSAYNGSISFQICSTPRHQGNSLSASHRVLPHGDRGEQLLASFADDVSVVLLSLLRTDA